MNLQEVNQRLTGFKITEKQLEDITPAYYTMNLDKDIFIKILEVVGVEEITRLKGYFEDVNAGYSEYIEKQSYLRCKVRLRDLKEREEELNERIELYEKKQYKELKS